MTKHLQARLGAGSLCERRVQALWPIWAVRSEPGLALPFAIAEGVAVHATASGDERILVRVLSNGEEAAARHESATWPIRLRWSLI